MYRVLLLMVLILAGFAPAMPVHAAKPLREKPVQDLAQWPDFLQRQNGAMQDLSACEGNAAACSPEMTRWSGLIGELRTQNRLRQIITVNKWFNRLPYKHDEYAYGTLDYWADTAELLQKRGDCEDYALSKYYTLRALGFSPEELKVTVVYDSEQFADHAVLMVYVNGTRYMLDINSDDTDPYPMDARYRTIYSFNEKTAWFYQ